jgi:hypothetical protein
MRAPAGLLVALALSLANAADVPAQAGGVQRCEGKDGAVAYSNTQCPPGTTPVRKVNTDPPVSVEARKAAQEQAKKDAAAAHKIDKERTQQETRQRRQADDRSKSDARAKERCEGARRALERAQATRSDLGARPATVEQMQKADREISRRESDVARDCAR